MSASVAAPMAGLPNHNLSPPDIPNFTATDFDHMNLDRSNDLVANNDNTTTSSHSNRVPQQDTSATEGRNRAVGNLLAALSSTPNGQSSEELPANDLNGIAQTQNPQIGSSLDSLGEEVLPHLPAWDAPATNNSLANIDLLPLSHDPPELSHTFVAGDIGDGLFPTFSPTTEFPPMAPSTSLRSEPSKSSQMPHIRNEFQAFAKLAFQDGNFYLNTYAVELGRDLHAYKAAQDRLEAEREAIQRGHPLPPPSHARSRHSRASGSRKIQPSIVSEAGGFAGVDSEAPDHSAERQSGKNSGHKSSQASDASATVQMHEVLMDPNRLPQFDYHKRVTEYAIEQGQLPPDYEQPAAVTADHMPDPHTVPLIPIHGTMQTADADVEGHKAISRRHVRLAWNFEKDVWELTVLGRNGAFLNTKFHHQGRVLPVESGSTIQISHVEVRFFLPTPPSVDPHPSIVDAEMPDLEVDADEVVPSIEHRPSETPAPEGIDTISQDHSTTPKINLKMPGQQPLIGSDGQPIMGPDGKPVYKKRGPGRPPKNGIMSNREHKEREKARRLEEMKAANGGVTPPPPSRGKLTKPTIETPVEDKSEKRKYKKRKRVDENGQPIPSVEGDETDQGEEEERKAKKARPQRERSESPEYPARHTLTAEQLARPTDPYATLLYKLLMEVYPEALALKQIYRLMKIRWPYFVHEVGTEGWQSSVRHNLNSEYQKLFDKGDKEGKGYAWKAIPNANFPQQDRKKAAAQQAQPKPKLGPPKTPFQPGPGQQIQWQNHPPYPPANGPPGMVNVNGQWQPQGQQQPPGWPPQTPSAQGLPTAMPPPPAIPGSSNAMQPPNDPSRTATPQPSPGAPLPPPNGVMPGTAPSSTVMPVTATSAPSNMPCTWAGVEAIKNFEKEMMKSVEVANPKRKDFWSWAFKSAQRRCLHGLTESLMAGEESKEERTLMSHIDAFIKNFANPNFKGFTHKKEENSPVPTGEVSESVNGESSGHRSAMGDNKLSAPSNDLIVPAMKRDDEGTTGNVLPSATTRNNPQSVASAQVPSANQVADVPAPTAGPDQGAATLVASTSDVRASVKAEPQPNVEALSGNVRDANNNTHPEA